MSTPKQHLVKIDYGLSDKSKDELKNLALATFNMLAAKEEIEKMEELIKQETANVQQES